MIELPRAALTAGEIAEAAEFFSFGTNDLTQMTFGLSRDDAEACFSATTSSGGSSTFDPFQTLDVEGVGRLIRLANTEGRAANPDLTVGVCGEHGGDPDSIAFCPRSRTRLRVVLHAPGPCGSTGGRPGRDRHSAAEAGSYRRGRRTTLWSPWHSRPIPRLCGRPPPAGTGAPSPESSRSSRTGVRAIDMILADRLTVTWSAAYAVGSHRCPRGRARARSPMRSSPDFERFMEESASWR